MLRKERLDAILENDSVPRSTSELYHAIKEGLRRAEVAITDKKWKEAIRYLQKIAALIAEGRSVSSGRDVPEALLPAMEAFERRMHKLYDKLETR